MKHTHTRARKAAHTQTHDSTRQNTQDKTRQKTHKKKTLSYKHHALQAISHGKTEHNATVRTNNTLAYQFHIHGSHVHSNAKRRREGMNGNITKQRREEKSSAKDQHAGLTQLKEGPSRNPPEWVE